VELIFSLDYQFFFFGNSWILDGYEETTRFAARGILVGCIVTMLLSTKQIYPHFGRKE
jgi:hypothetical protein